MRRGARAPLPSKTALSARALSQHGKERDLCGERRAVLSSHDATSYAIASQRACLCLRASSLTLRSGSAAHAQRSLLPHGQHAAVLAAKAPVSGCTVHFVDAGVDTGAVLWQEACAVDAARDSPEDLKARVQALEGRALVESVRLFLDDADVDLLRALRRADGDFAAVAPLLPGFHKSSVSVMRPSLIPIFV